MNIHRVKANRKVKSDRGKVALQRGPIVYSAEWVDNSANVLEVKILDSTHFESIYKKNLLEGVTILKGKVLDANGKPTMLTLIPYYAWSNRGVGKMNVWFDEI